MPELDKVITALQHCIDKPCHINCPYFEPNDKTQAYCLFKKILPDALALLKRQEPRVLTLEETIALCGEPVWLEENTLHGSYGAWGVVKGLNEQYKAVNIGGVRFGYWPRAKYNITWRCWTARPTDEQRKAVKWDV